MPIFTRHPSFDAQVDNWQTMRDVMAGEDAIKKAGERYLPKLGGHSLDEYKAYKTRAQFYGACTRTLEALAGAVCRKPPVLRGSEDFVKKYTQDITGTGVTFASFVGELVREIMTTGMEGLLVDFNGTRPYIAPYSAENVINMLPDGTVVLAETEMVTSDKDKYVLESKTNYRELTIIDGVVTRCLWKPDNKGKYETHEDKALEFRGQPIKEIPFALATLPSMQLLPLAQANLSHYLTSADLENGLHWGGIFTPWIASQPLNDANGVGVKEMRVGSSTAWMLPQGATVGMLEISGAALSALEARLLGKQELMAALGARLLIAPKKTAETAETSRINASGEGATLSLVVDACESALTKAMKILAQWDGVTATDDISVELNRDFVDANITPEELTAYLAAVQAGKMSMDVFLYLCQGGELWPAGRTVEDEKSAIEQDNLTRGPEPFGAGVGMGGLTSQSIPGARGRAAAK